MKDNCQTLLKSISIPVLLGLAMLFSCENDISEVRELTDAEDLPAIHATNIETIYSDSSIVRLKITAPELLEFTEKEDRPAYIEFPKGLHAVFYSQAQVIESTMDAEYAIFHHKTEKFEARRNVVVKNHAEKQELYTELLYWNKEKEQIWTDKFVKIIQPDGLPIYGDEGFEADQNFTRYRIMKSRGSLEVEEEKK
ncbi:MAG: LPS export ABC transporter periplasmic protein LptC [Bacteroidetes bacterium]|jgi:LPS export ABC transporter protein LptC|nr:LPS export ABC transporter periplasmic protein LptC [Bacteroidota bacterium]MBT3747604.1 LPS export ABC transporter periplasmic protein LptC [Bacteroidota bacterium]MBT4398477.1 LPS export ABC transporter periplasmic protein LptC [Bacteroidota bacterium]MBT4409228.1 LPS export ABC transporter periplasmic protein LptC [Bacteroidota bacterium]MBT5427596.1 LPS export ABC transporter periplasmic protein LptC [Bacteroidota bacterium]